MAEAEETKLKEILETFKRELKEAFETAIRARETEGIDIPIGESRQRTVLEAFERAHREALERALKDVLPISLRKTVREELDRPIDDPRGRPTIELIKKLRREERERKESDPNEIARRAERERKETEARERAMTENTSLRGLNEGRWISMPQFFASANREVRICHETGILCYDTLWSFIPVGQFIAPAPLGRENARCSFTIMAPGSIKGISIGLVPQNYQQDQQPGWDSRSIGYHADDGGIFMETGAFSHQTTETCDVGDVMEVEIDVDRGKGWFRKNGRQMFEFSLRMCDLYPCIGLYSKGEAVKLNEKEVWAAGMNEPSQIPNDFRTYKYDSLWISERITLSTLDKSCSGWVILHNPTHSHVCYKVSIGNNVHVKIGKLKHQEQYVDFVDISDADHLEQIHAATVEWVTLELDREYSLNDLEQSLRVMGGRKWHRLDIGLSEDMQYLQTEEESLREKEDQLRTKEEQLSEKENQLRTKEEQLNEREELLREEREKKEQEERERQEREEMDRQKRDEKDRKDREEADNLCPLSLEESLKQKQIPMLETDTELFRGFLRRFGATRLFSNDQQSLSDVQVSLNTTEKYIQQNCRDEIKEQWREYKEQGILARELIGVICLEEHNQELHAKTIQYLTLMEHLNVIAKAKSFDENGVKEEDYYISTSMIHRECPREVISPEEDHCMESTSALCFVFKGQLLPSYIFHKLVAACADLWPVAKTKEKEKLLFCGCVVFQLDLLHRLTLHRTNHAIVARIAKMKTAIDDVKTPNEKLCSKVRRRLNQNLTEITASSATQNIQYDLCILIEEAQTVPEYIMSNFSLPFQMWFAEEGNDPDAPIQPEHMNHSRLGIAIETVCGTAMRNILLTKYPPSYPDIYQAILANKTNLAKRTLTGKGKDLLNKDQLGIVFPNPNDPQYVATVDKFDISLVYTLIRNVSSVTPPVSGWDKDPYKWDKQLGASVERIHLFRNRIIAHSVNSKISKKDFEDHWNAIDAVVHDIDSALGNQLYSPQLEKQKRLVISIYEA